MKYNFDEITDRSGTYCEKLEEMPEGFAGDGMSLGVADMDFACAEPVLSAMRERLDRKIFGYTVSGSTDSKNAVRGWFSSRYGWEIDPDSMYFCPGIITALTLLIYLLTDEGDGIIIQPPVYTPFMTKVRLSGRRVVENPLIDTGSSYEMDFELLERQVKLPENKLFILCNPHNPVGRAWSEEELGRVLELCRAYGKWIISDEIHCDLTRKGISYTPLMRLAREKERYTYGGPEREGNYCDRIVSCISPGKTFNIAGLEFSRIIIPDKGLRERWEKLAYRQLVLQVCNPFGLAAEMAAYRYGGEWLEQLREYIDGNLDFIEDFLKDELPKARMYRPEATYLAWVDLSAYVPDPHRLERLMLDKAHVQLSEGYKFGTGGEGFERINTAVPRSVLKQCMVRIKKALEEA